MNAADLRPGDRVIYIPAHAHGDIKHADCERGIVSSTRGDVAFVRYVRNGLLQSTVQATGAERLVRE